MKDNQKDSFELTIKLYSSLQKYKRYFLDAINIYNNRAIGKFSCDYVPVTNKTIEKKISTRVKIEHEPIYFKKLFENIEKSELEIMNENRNHDDKITKINRTILINNIMSTLVGIEQYNYEVIKERKNEQ
jgi:hypothetical protein